MRNTSFLTSEKGGPSCPKWGGGGELIWAMPESKHSFFREVFPYLTNFFILRHMINLTFVWQIMEIFIEIVFVNLMHICHSGATGSQLLHNMCKKWGWGKKVCNLCNQTFCAIVCHSFAPHGVNSNFFAISFYASAACPKYSHVPSFGKSQKPDPNICVAQITCHNMCACQWKVRI